jgi:hypothetical protein
MFTFALITAQLEPAVDEAKGYASLEKAVKQGQFGKDPQKVTKKMLGDRPGVAFDLREGDTVFSAWAVYNNEESGVLLKVRKDAGIPAAAQKIFFESLKFGIDKPPQKKGAEGGPGVGPPGSGGGAGAPPAPPPLPPPPKM